MKNFNILGFFLLKHLNLGERGGVRGKGGREGHEKPI